MSSKRVVATRPEIGAPALEASNLRWTCPREWLDFETTGTVTPLTGTEAQNDAIEALRFGLACRGLGHLFVRGAHGGDHLAMVAELVSQLEPTPCDRFEFAYVRNFSAPERPRLLKLRPGSGEVLRAQVRELADFISDGLSDALQSSTVRERLDQIRGEEQAAVTEATEELKKALENEGLELVSVKEDGHERPAILPVIDGRPVSVSELEQLKSRGEISSERFRKLSSAIERFQPQVTTVIGMVGQILRRSAARRRQLSEGPARWVLTDSIRDWVDDYPDPNVRKFLDELIDDVISERLHGTEVRPFDPSSVYGIHLIESGSKRAPFPVVVENHPTLANLAGSVDALTNKEAEHHAIRAGAIVRANGGCLILDAEDLRSEPGSWKVLVRTLKSNQLEVVPPELSGTSAVPQMKPDPVPVDLKVVLVGDGKTFRELDHQDSSFGELFKVLVDFDSSIERSREGAMLYAGVLARLAGKEQLPDFDRSAVAALVEQGSRLSDRPGRLSAHFAKVEDIARESAFHVPSATKGTVGAEHVATAVERARSRADLPARRYRGLLRQGTYNIELQGEIVGQINGLAVMKAAQLTYGFPARLTASTGPGDQGIIDIESRASLSGNIHTKGMHILDGLLRYILKPDFPLTFNASLAFEQSYGSIDGDSASGAEICCLLSSLADLPIQQGIAMTGSIDQRGRIQAVGGVNDKIEGYFDVCDDAGLTGKQGVIIPASNVGGLMLRGDVVEACERSSFRIISVRWVQEAVEVLTGVSCGEWVEGEGFPRDSVLGRARARAREYWLQSIRKK